MNRIHLERSEDNRRYLAELAGTFVLVLGGVGSAVLGGGPNGMIGQAGIALAFGLSLLAMVYAVGPVSGAHLNPAVTLGVLLAGKMEPRRAPYYMLAQVLGAFAAAVIVMLVAHGQAGGYQASVQGLGANGYGAHSPGGYGLAAAFLAELVLTAVLVFTVLCATDSRSPVGFAGLAIGLALTVVHLVGIPITGTSVNPARSIGPALLVGGWAIGQLWLFIVAPLLGGAAAAAVYRTLLEPERRISPRRAERALPGEQRQREVHP